MSLISKSARVLANYRAASAYFTIRNQSLDVLRCIAILLVLGRHTFKFYQMDITLSTSKERAAA
jgi:peptidoglycan/LPS O-acetylase OafA/YrhL